MAEQNRIHYIAMAGLHGCIPNYCDVYASFDDAVESLCQVHDLGPYSRFRKELKKHGYTELNLRKHGNAYAEVSECSCEEPWIHSDSGESPFDDMPSPVQISRYQSYEGQARWPGGLA